MIKRPVSCGRPGACSETGGLRDTNEPYEVRCCSDSFRAGWTKRTDRGCSVWAESDAWSSCSADKTFAQAKFICEAVAGARLCTVAELEAGCTAGTGCLFDHDLIWALP